MVSMFPIFTISSIFSATKRSNKSAQTTILQQEKTHRLNNPRFREHCRNPRKPNQTHWSNGFNNPST